MAPIKRLLIYKKQLVSNLYYKMSTPPEKIVANYDSKSKQTKLVAAEMKKIV